MVKTSIIVLTYNSAKYIESLIESIYKFNDGENFECLIVDNASVDETLKAASKLKRKGLRVIKSEKNLGFAAGINVGAKNSKGEYLLFINPDTEWKKGKISEMISVFEENIGVGIVGGKMVGQDGRAEFSVGRFMGLVPSFATAFGLDNVLKIRSSPRNTSSVDYVSGGFMMVKSDLFQELKGFDENLFIYVEDMELCFRAKLAGYSTYFTPEVVLFHASHGSSNRGFAISNIYKGLFYFHKKHGTALSYFAVKSLFLAKAAALVMVGKILNNKYLTETYSEALK